MPSSSPRRERRRRRGAPRRSLRLAGAVRRNGVGSAILAGATFLICGAGLGLEAFAEPQALPLSRPSPEQMRLLKRGVAGEARWMPADAASSLRLVYLDGLSGSVTREGVVALRRSYALEPLGPDATRWRLEFIFNHWSALPSDVRTSAEAELGAAFPRHGWALRDIPGRVADPSGRLAAQLMLLKMRTNLSVPDDQNVR